MRVRFSPRALRQIDEIFAYIAQDNEVAAKSVVARIETIAQLIGTRPHIGRATSRDGVRVMSVPPYPYVIYYKILDDSEEARIMRIRHTSRR